MIIKTFGYNEFRKKVVHEVVQREETIHPHLLYYVTLVQEKNHRQHLLSIVRDWMLRETIFYNGVLCSVSDYFASNNAGVLLISIPNYVNHILQEFGLGSLCRKTLHYINICEAEIDDIFQKRTREIRESISRILTQRTSSSVRPCPTNGCGGFIHTNSTCPVCHKAFCEECETTYLIDQPHECDPKLKESVAYIKIFSRRCPSCNTPVEKSEGCAQMLCTSCFTPFHWTNANPIEYVYYHNPYIILAPEEKQAQIQSNCSYANFAERVTDSRELYTPRIIQIVRLFKYSFTDIERMAQIRDRLAQMYDTTNVQGFVKKELEYLFTKRVRATIVLLCINVFDIYLNEIENINEAFCMFVEMYNTRIDEICTNFRKSLNVKMKMKIEFGLETLKFRDFNYLETIIRSIQ